MKKIATLLLFVAAYGGVKAQTTEDAKRVILGPKKTSTSGSNDPRGVILGGGSDGGVYGDNGTRYPNGTNGSRQQQIDQVNREYDQKIASVRNNRYLSASEKERTIRQLEADRARRIRAINDRYYGDQQSRKRDDRDRRHDDDDDRDHDRKKYKKSNPGKHLGWEKGVGNPHRSSSYNSHKSDHGKSNGKGKGKKH